MVKLVMAIVAIFFISAMAQEQIFEPAYPRAMLAPLSAIEGDSVTLWIIKGIHGNGCTPTYPDVSYTITMKPEKIFPPRYEITLSYTQKPYSGRGACTQGFTEYGPKFTFKNLTVGNYTFTDGITLGTFEVMQKMVLTF